MNRETLMEMPISQLRGLDIRTKEDEILVQDVLNEKFQNEPGYGVRGSSFRSVDTDNMTPEKEAELQSTLDEDPLDVPEEDEEESVPEEPVLDPVEEPEEPVLEPEIQPENSVESKPFCEYCDAKGPVKHKNSCTRLSANNIT